jgi:hypothetical protein
MAPFGNAGIAARFAPAGLDGDRGIAARFAPAGLDGDRGRRLVEKGSTGPTGVPKIGTGVMGVDSRILAQAMDREAGLLEEFAREQEGLLDSVRARSWADLERKLDALRALEARVQEADRQRLEALPEGAADAAAYASLVGGLQRAKRVELEGSYHALSLAVVRVKGALSRLDHYLTAVTGSLNAVLGELLPYRKGRIYSARGHQREAADAPILVDRKL